MNVRELFVRLGLDTDAQSFAKGQLAVDGIVGGLEKIVDAASETARAFVEHVKETAEFGHEIERASMSTGIATDALQQLQYAAKATGTNFETLRFGMFFLARSMAEAKHGAGAAAAAYHKLGVRVTDARGILRSADDVLMDVIDGMDGLKDQGERASLAMELFGRGGREMLPFLASGSAEIRELREEAAVLSEDQIKNAAQLALTQTRLQQSTQNLWRGAIGPLLPDLNKLAQAFLAWRKENQKLLAQKISSFLGGLIKIIRALGGAFAFAIQLGRDLAGHWKVLTLAAVALSAAMLVLETDAVMAAAASTAAWLAAVAPIAAVSAAVMGIILLFNSLARWADGKDSVLGEMFWKARLAMQRFANDPGIGDPWFVRMLREAAHLADVVEQKLDHLFHFMKAYSAELDNRSGGEEASMWSVLGSARLVYKGIRAGMAANRDYVPLDEREQMHPSLAYLQATGAVAEPGSVPYYVASPSSGEASQANLTFHINGGDPAAVRAAVGQALQDAGVVTQTDLESAHAAAAASE